MSGGYITFGGLGGARQVAVNGPVTLSTLLEKAGVTYDESKDYRTQQAQVGPETVLNPGDTVFAAKAYANGSA